MTCFTPHVLSGSRIGSRRAASHRAARRFGEDATGMESDGSLSLVALALATLAGGLVGSFGINAFIKSALGRRLVAKWRVWALFVYAAVVLGVVAVGVTWIFQRMVTADDAQRMLSSPWPFLMFGFLGGLPFTIPNLITVRRAQRALPVTEKARRATVEDRVTFAKDLERQIREFVEDGREIRVELGGEKRRTLFLHGDIARHQAERLVRALRADMQAADFTRVEGDGGAKGGKWWVRV